MSNTLLKMNKMNTLFFLFFFSHEKDATFGGGDSMHN